MNFSSVYNYIRYVLDTPKQHHDYVDLELDRIEPVFEKEKSRREPEMFTFSDEEIYEYERTEFLKKLTREKKMLAKLERQRRRRNKSRIKKNNSVEIVDGLDFVKQDYNKHVNLVAYKHKNKKDYYKYVLHVEKCYGPNHPSGKFIEVDTSVFTTHDIKRNLIYMTPKRLK